MLISVTLISHNLIPKRCNYIGNMGRKVKSEPLQKHAWILSVIDEINAMPRTLEAAKRSPSLFENRRNLRRLIKLAAYSSKTGVNIAHTVQDSLLVEINPRSEVELVFDGLIRRIIDEKVPIDRLRICPSCDRIFWMKTARSKTCGLKRCSDRTDYLTNKKGK
jgi:hypothetical protein